MASSKKVLKKLLSTEMKQYYKIITKGKITDYDINWPGVYRTGLELADITMIPKRYKNIVVWGTRECQYFEIHKKNIIKKIGLIFDAKPPLLLLSKGVPPKWCKKIATLAEERKITVLATTLHVRAIATHIHALLSPIFASHTTLHGSLVSVYNVGIFIIGKSGIGKSEAVLELLQKGHAFVADDAVKIKKVGTNFFGSAPQITEDFLEVRGIGIIDVKKIFGVKSVVYNQQIDLVVKLESIDSKFKFDRLGYSYKKYKILDSWIPYSIIPVSQGRSIASLIQLSANVFNMKREKDYVSIKDELKRRFNNES